VDFKVLYTEGALADLADIFARSWEEHPGTTERFASSLLNHVDLLKTFPRMGGPVSGYPGVRRLTHSPLQVFYRLDEPRRVVEILYFWHGARKSPKFE
jgi:plasmid stabilization system protein ParE